MKKISLILFNIVFLAHPVASAKECERTPEGNLYVYVEDTVLNYQTDDYIKKSVPYKEWFNEKDIYKGKSLDILKMPRIENFAFNHSLAGYKLTLPIDTSVQGNTLIGVIPCDNYFCNEKIVFSAPSLIAIFSQKGDDTKVINVDNKWVSDAVWSPSGDYLAIISQLHTNERRTLKDLLLGWVHYPGYQDVFLGIYDSSGTILCESSVAKNLREASTGLIWK